MLLIKVIKDDLMTTRCRSTEKQIITHHIAHVSMCAYGDCPSATYNALVKSIYVLFSFSDISCSSSCSHDFLAMKITSITSFAMNFIDIA